MRRSGIMAKLRGGSRARAARHRLQPRAHGRPVVVDDAVVHAVALVRVLREHVLAEHAFFRRADALDRTLGVRVPRVRLQFDAQTAERLERVTQEQVLALRVDRGALRARRQPRAADLEPPVTRADVKVARAAHGLARRAFDQRERKLCARGLTGERIIDVARELLARTRPVRQPRPDLVRLACTHQRLGVLRGQRIQADVRAFERDRLNLQARGGLRGQSAIPSCSR
jgi:hypothetical protein